jgi:hypothetical protein
VLFRLRRQGTDKAGEVLEVVATIADGKTMFAARLRGDAPAIFEEARQANAPDDSLPPE